MLYLDQYFSVSIQILLFYNNCASCSQWEKEYTKCLYYLPQTHKICYSPKIKHKQNILDYNPKYQRVLIKLTNMSTHTYQALPFITHCWKLLTENKMLYILCLKSTFLFQLIYIFSSRVYKSIYVCVYKYFRHFCIATKHSTQILNF